MRNRLVAVVQWVITSFLFAASALYAAEQEAVAVVDVADNLYMLTGPGGNVGLFVGDDANLLIDDKYADQAKEILTAVKKVTNKPLNYLVNTHWHSDHSGGNQAIGRTGAVIIAHDNVHRLLASGTQLKALGSVIEPYPKVALPQISFASTMTLHVNGETLSIQHMPNAHTDGDSVLFFKKANVVHTGDLFFNGFYPFIDAEHGGRIKGMITGVQQILAQVNDKTVIIPGHGPLAGRDELLSFKAMLEASVAAVEPLLEQQLNLEEIIAKKPTQALDGLWGGGFLAPDQWVEMVVNSLAD